MPLRGRTAAPTLAAIHRPRGRASRLAQARLGGVGRCGAGGAAKAPGRFPGQRRAKRTPTPQAPTDAASQAATTDAPLLRRLPRAPPGCPARRLRRRSDGGRPKTKRRKRTTRRQRVNSPREKRPSTSRPPFPPSCSPLSPRSSLRSHAPSALRRGFSAGRASARNIGRRH